MATRRLSPEHEIKCGGPSRGHAASSPRVLVLRRTLARTLDRRSHTQNHRSRSVNHLACPRLIWATSRATLIVYREPSDMGGEPSTPGCSPRHRQEFHRPERSPHETVIHTPDSRQGHADRHGPEEGRRFQAQSVSSRFRGRSKWPAEVGCGCMGK